MDTLGVSQGTVGWGPPRAGPAGDAWAAFPEDMVLVKIPASKQPSCTASGGALGATSSACPSRQVREPGFSLVLEAAAFPAGPAQFLGSEASQVTSVQQGLGVFLRGPPGEGPHALWLSLQGRGRRLLRQRLLRRQLSSVSAPRGGRPGPRRPQPPIRMGLGQPSPTRLGGPGLHPSTAASIPPLPKHAMFLPPCLCPSWPLFLEGHCSPLVSSAGGGGGVAQSSWLLPSSRQGCPTAAPAPWGPSGET